MTKHVAFAQIQNRSLISHYKRSIQILQTILACIMQLNTARKLLFVMCSAATIMTIEIGSVVPKNRRPDKRTQLLVNQSRYIHKIKIQAASMFVRSC
jgi:hypothetical protein